ncbi:MAG: rhomboid family intramembrane serine protease [Woeseia sp.]|nr:rhomboid family intramembrane serine protease [Woeseia sp.]NNL54136.1 rhomboid family intramembrane serine protease [Woeseia sp.]
MTPHGWAVLFESDRQRACADRMLVLTSLEIPHQLLTDGGRFILIVTEADLHRARHELYLYEQENRPPARPGVAMLPAQYDPWPGVIAYLLVLTATAWLAGEQAFDSDWLTAGRVDGAMIRDGQWWRVFTALTLHKDIGHLLGNMGFGAFFGFLAARVIGSGVTWLTVVIAAGLANGLNTWLLVASHRSIGASTAVFAALGLVAGFVWRGRLMAQDRWPYRLGPIIGGIALLAYTGTGDESTDIGAHLAGFVCGFGSGIVLTHLSRVFRDGRLQMLCGIAAPALLVGAWWLALR